MLFSVTDILEHSTDILLRTLLPQQQILYASHRSILALIREVVPSACIAVQHSRSLKHLPAILASLALERIVCIAGCARSVLEEFSQGL